MGFLDSFKSLFAGGGQNGDASYWLYVRCRRCGEVIRSRVDLRNDVSPRDEGGYVCRKTLVGSERCFERMEVTLIFDEGRQIVDRQVAGGDFVTAEDFEAAG